MADDDKRTTSAAKELGSDFQSDALAQQETVTHNFQDKADPTYTAQLEAMGKNDLENAESGDGSDMISGDGNRHNMHPPSDMRSGPDKASYEERLAAENWKESGADAFLEEHASGSEFDNADENSSDYDNDM